jgi:hypothetical protein
MFQESRVELSLGGNRLTPGGKGEKMGTRAGRIPRATLPVVVALLLLPSSSRRALAGGVVGTGNPSTCTEGALDSALAGGGSVTFNCGASPVTITVTSTKTIIHDTTIDGGGVVTISGGNSVGVFLVNAPVNFTVQNLTIANGFSYGDGGGILNGGTLTVTNSTFSGNSTSYGGGGIWNAGTLTVTNSTFSGNNASDGGGIFNYVGGTLTVTNSTFSGNSTSYDGGAIYNAGGTLSVTNSTFTGNGADSGGGIYSNGGTVTVTNAIIANSISTWGGNCNGAVTDGGHNIDDGTTCGFTGTGCTPTTGTSFCNTNPQLAAGLANNGGPTQTVALEAGSPAINAGNEAICAASPVNNLDQRGFVRPGTGAANCSIGAYEFNSGVPCGSGFCVSAQVCISGQCATPTPTSTWTATPTRTATPTVTQTLTPTPTPRIVHIDVGSANGLPGGTVTVAVSLRSSGTSVAATGNDISFDPGTLSLDPSDCQVNPAIGKSLVTSVVQDDVSTKTLRFFVQSAQNTSPIPDGTLYTCAFSVAPSALPGTYLLSTDYADAFSPQGTQLPNTVGSEGFVVVSLVPLVCVGDCNDDGTVTIDEILTMVNIALGNADATACPNGIPSGTQVDVALILQAVNNALNGCGG